MRRTLTINVRARLGAGGGAKRQWNAGGSQRANPALLCPGTSSSPWIHHCNIHQPHQHCSVLSSLVGTAELPPEPRAPRGFQFPGCFPPLPCSSPDVGASLSSLSQGGCCVPVFGFLSSDPDGPRSPVAPQWCLCSLTMQMAELGFAGTARCIFQFIFLYLFPGTHFSSFPQGWCVGITVPCFCAFPDLVKNSFSLKESFSKLTQIMNY